MKESRLIHYNNRASASVGSTVEVSEIESLANGTIIVGDGSGAPTTLAAFTASNGTLKHESGGIEANISAIADGGILVGTGAGTMAVRSSALTGGASGFIKHELGGIEADISAIADGGLLVGTGVGTMAIRESVLTGGAAGFLKHEVGGLEADVSAYAGFVHITGGATSAVAAAVASDLNTGTDASKPVTSDSLAGSNIGTKVLEVVAFDFTTDVATGDGKAYATVPSSFAGMNLVNAHARVITAGTTNSTTIQIHNLTQAADMLSALLEVETGETGSNTADPGITIDTNNDDVAAWDVIRIDVDTVSTTAPKGLIITLEFQLP